MKSFEITFWGTRGSCPASSKSHMEYGCNTLCIAANINGCHLIFDGGTGLRNYGEHTEFTSGDNIHIFLSHMHMDHIEGLPFFRWMYQPDINIHFYAHGENGKTAAELLNIYFTAPFFPVDFLGDGAIANIFFHELDQSGKMILQDNIEISYMSLSHPSGCLAYKVAANDKSFCYMTDHELYFDTEIDKQANAFAKHSDLLVIDTFYLDTPVNFGWGHSSWNDVLNFAQSVKQVAMFHYGPSLDDAKISQGYDKYSKQYPNMILSKEQTTITLVSTD